MINITRYVAICLSILLLNVCIGQESASVLKRAADVTLQNAGKQVTLIGTVEKWQPSRNASAPNSFILRDNSGVVRVCIWSDTYMKVYGIDKMKDGVKVEATGLVKDFRGKAELHVREAKWLKIGALAGGAIATGAADKSSSATKTAASPAGITKISTITAGLSGQVVMIEGKIGGVRAAASERTPWTININDGSGMAIDAVFWKEDGVALPEQKPAKDETWRVKGTVGLYRGHVQIKTVYPKDWTKK